MTNLLDDAVEVLRSLPENVQEAAARTIIDYASSYEDQRTSGSAPSLGGMEKDFDRWNKLKKAINASDEVARAYFHEGDIWWVRLGVNVGFEIDGKHKDFARPVIVLKKYNQYSFLALPLTTAGRPNRWRVAIGDVAGKEASAVLSQLRNLDSLGLYQKIGHVEADLLGRIKKTASRMNFG